MAIIAKKKQAGTSRLYCVDGMETDWPKVPGCPAGYAPSVTEVLKVINKPMLLAWAAKMEAESWERAVVAAENSKEYGEGFLDAVLNRLGHKPGQAHRAAYGTAADFGSLVHKGIETLLTTGKIDMPEGPEREAVVRFEAWAKGVDLKPTLIEAKVHHAQLRYAGTLDFCGYVNGVASVVDWKTSNAIYPEHEAQAVAYADTFNPEADGGEPVDTIRQCLVLRIPKTQEEADKLEKKSGYPFELKVVDPERRIALRKLFRGALQTWYALQEVS